MLRLFSLQPFPEKHAHVRTTLSGVPYMQEVMPVTLHEGGNSEFEAACKAVKGQR
jgi:hypothetical protein